MMTCKDATRRISEQLDRPLSTAERIGLRLHLMMCRGCRNFQDNMRFMRSALSRVAQSDDTQMPHKD